MSFRWRPRQVPGVLRGYQVSGVLGGPGLSALTFLETCLVSTTPQALNAGPVRILAPSTGRHRGGPRGFDTQGLASHRLVLGSPGTGGAAPVWRKWAPHVDIRPRSRGGTWCVDVLDMGSIFFLEHWRLKTPRGGKSRTPLANQRFGGVPYPGQPRTDWPKDEAHPRAATG